MEENADRLDEKEKRFSVAAVLGLMLMVGAAFIGGPLGIAASVIGGTMFGYAMCTAFCSDKGDACTLRTCWQERDGTDTPAEPEQAIILYPHATKSVGKWLERVERAAEGEAAKRGR